jgi:hypothetical protein
VVEHGVRIDHAHQAVVHDHVREGEQVGEPLLVGREQRDHHEEVEVGLGAAVPQVDEHGRGRQQRRGGGRGARAAAEALEPAERRQHADRRDGQQRVAQRVSRDESEHDEERHVHPRDRGDRAMSLGPDSRRKRLSSRQPVAPGGQIHVLDHRPIAWWD